MTPPDGKTRAQPDLARAPHRRWWRRLARRAPALASSTRRVAVMLVASIALSYHVYLWLWLTGGMGKQGEADFFRFVFLLGSFPVLLAAAIPMLVTGSEPPAFFYQSARRAGMPPLTRFGSLTWVIAWLALLLGRPDVAVTASLIGQLERGFVGLAERQPRGFRRALLEAPWRLAFLMNQPLIYPWLLLGGWILAQLDRPRVVERVRSLPEREAFIAEMIQRAGKSGNPVGLAARLVAMGEYRRAQSVLLEAPPAYREVAARGMLLEDLVDLEEGRFEHVITRYSDASELKPNQRAALALAHLKAGDPEKARALAEEANGRRDARLRETLAQAHWALGDRSAAIEAAEEALAIGGSGSARLLGVLGRWLLEMGDAVEARVVLTRAVLSADFLEAEVVEDLAVALTEVGRGAEAARVREALAGRKAS